MTKGNNVLFANDRIKVSIYLERNREEFHGKKTLKEITAEVKKETKINVNENNIDSLLELVGITPHKTHENSYTKLAKEKADMEAGFQAHLENHDRAIRRLEEKVRELQTQNDDLLRMLSETDRVARNASRDNQWPKATPPHPTLNGTQLKPTSDS